MNTQEPSNGMFSEYFQKQIDECIERLNPEDVNLMIGIKIKLESCPLALDTTRNDDPNDKKNFRRCLRSVAYRKILKDVNAYLHVHCKHDFVEDLIDIDPDLSQTIKYCCKCLLTKS